MPIVEKKLDAFLAAFQASLRFEERPLGRLRALRLEAILRQRAKSMGQGVRIQNPAGQVSVPAFIFNRRQTRPPRLKAKPMAGRRRPAQTKNSPLDLKFF
jgi:hypothetical protein